MFEVAMWAGAAVGNKSSRIAGVDRDPIGSITIRIRNQLKYGKEGLIMPG